MSEFDWNLQMTKELMRILVNENFDELVMILLMEEILYHLECINPYN